MDTGQLHSSSERVAPLCEGADSESQGRACESQGYPSEGQGHPRESQGAACESQGAACQSAGPVQLMETNPFQGQAWDGPVQLTVQLMATNPFQGQAWDFPVQLMETKAPFQSQAWDFQVQLMETKTRFQSHAADKLGKNWSSSPQQGTTIAISAAQADTNPVQGQAWDFPGQLIETTAPFQAHAAEKLGKSWSSSPWQGQPTAINASQAKT